MEQERMQALDRALKDIANGGLSYMASFSAASRHWSSIVDEIENGYFLNLDDYNNDIFFRVILDEVLREVDSSIADEARALLKPDDDRFLELTQPRPTRLHLDDERELFWLSRLPKHPMGELLDDMTHGAYRLAGLTSSEIGL